MAYNIAQPRNISQLVTIIFYLTPLSITAQRNKASDLPMVVVSSVTSYLTSVQHDENQKMINLGKKIPTIQLDLRYASTNNFMHRKMYKENPKSTFMRLPAAKALIQVQKALNKKGLGLKVFDAYRPYSVTKDFWDLVHDERYVANPSKGSGHNRGIAVDLCIINLKTKKELKMPTGFDDFTDSAHHDFDDLPADVLANRALLKSTMLKYGFKAFATEWWHYSLPDPEKFPVLDLSFADLEGL
ncbi:MAG: M15 family metallopeptidase [Bacteroidetes bacterium]|jgi:zinc D-Ala-D-Ala dipeptidase|nr:M15 family metallopeptidase [Bacteroidota bacterium]